MNTSGDASGRAAQSVSDEPLARAAGVMNEWAGDPEAEVRNDRDAGAGLQADETAGEGPFWIRHRWAVPAAAVLLGALIAGTCAWTVLSHNAALRRALEYPWWQPIPVEEMEAYRAEQEAKAAEAAFQKAEEEERERLERARKAQEAREQETQDESNAQDESSVTDEGDTQDEDTPETAEEQPQGVLPDHIIFVGDSRTVQMKRAVRYDSSVCSFIAQSSMGYEWFRDEAVPAVDSALWSMGGNIAVVVNMGVNDLSDAEQYVKLVNRKAAEWASRGADTYYMSVNPVDDARTQVQNSQIEEFNAYVQDALSEGIEWIDSYDFLTAYGYDSNVACAAWSATMSATSARPTMSPILRNLGLSIRPFTNNNHHKTWLWY